jgi:hypothetical protein
MHVCMPLVFLSMTTYLSSSPCIVHVCLNGWMDGWMVGQNNGWMVGQNNGCRCVSLLSVSMSLLLSTWVYQTFFLHWFRRRLVYSMLMSMMSMA